MARGGARRLLLRPRHRPVRRAGLALCLWLALLGAGGELRAQTVTGAEFARPTTRYDHGVLGDAVEWGALRLSLSDGRVQMLSLPEDRVFEDLAPRLADLDGDGAPEVIVIESSLTQGARLSVYGPGGLIAATPYIGRSHRWLAPLGAADLDGDGRVEIAYIDRPHLAKTLRIWRFQQGRLVHVADRAGLSNHRIGWDFIIGGIRDCGSGPEVIAASGDWRHILAARLRGGRITTSPIGRYDGPDSLTAPLACR